MPNKHDYDAVIIGAGISGLVCGCYLAKAGMKVLIVEKNAKPGGYCTSFTRKGYTFDACAHSLGSLRKGGNIYTVLKELDLYERINIVRYNPSDIIIGPDFKISFWNDLERTISEFQENFPNEAKHIRNFFVYLDENSGMSLLANLRNKTFKDLLDSYFEDHKLKAILSLPVLGNVGLPPSLVSAITAATIYKEYICDGGNYFEGGMQKLPNILAKKLKESGGEIILSKLVNKIMTKDNAVKGIILEDNSFISAKYVVSNVDARHTFFEMLNNNSTDKNALDKLKSMTPSLSMFILYLGIDQFFYGFPEIPSNIWRLPHYDIESMYLTAINGDVDDSDWFLFRASKDKRNILMLVNASFNTEQYWKENKDRLTDLFIRKIENLIPDLSKHIALKISATPHTLYRHTLNYKGSAYGWNSTPSQFAVSEFTQKTSINNLYLTGHWTTLAQGISGVSYLGRSTARIILNKGKYNA